MYRRGARGVGEGQVRQDKLGCGLSRDPSRFRQDISRDDKRGLEMFVLGDQLLRGADLNAVEIAEHLIKCNLV